MPIEFDDLGQTTISGGDAELTASLEQALRNSNTQLSARLLVDALDWFALKNENRDRPSNARQDAITVSTPEFPWSFSGWAPTVPPEPYRTPPLPLDLALPLDAPSPIEQIAPWWDAIVLRRSPDEPLKQLSGKTLNVSAWDPFSTWPRMEGAGLGVASALKIFDEHIEAHVLLSQAVERVQGPGRFGSLIPIYSEARSLLSASTRSSENATLGCRINLDWISAISFTFEHSTFAQLLGRKKWKALIDSRGYGAPDRYSIGLEIDDGWRPYRVSVEGAGPSLEVEASIYQTAGWLVKHVAGSRLANPNLSDQERHDLGKAANGDQQIHEVREKNMMTRGFRIVLAGHRPISVPLEVT